MNRMKRKDKSCKSKRWGLLQTIGRNLETQKVPRRNRSLCAFTAFTNPSKAGTNGNVEATASVDLLFERQRSKRDPAQDGPKMIYRISKSRESCHPVKNTNRDFSDSYRNRTTERNRQDARTSSGKDAT
jgi:hypothetical protein